MKASLRDAVGCLFLITVLGICASEARLQEPEKVPAPRKDGEPEQIGAPRGGGQPEQLRMPPKPDGEFGGPPRFASAYVYNNTKHDIRYAVSSSLGVASGVVPPGKYGRFGFQPDNRHRALTVFLTANGQCISARFPVFADGRAYNALHAPKTEQMRLPDGSVRTVEAPDQGARVTPDPESITQADHSEPEPLSGPAGGAERIQSQFK